MEPGVDAFPYRSFRTGARGSLHVISNTLHDNIDKFCTGTDLGFRMIIHAPYEMPIRNFQFSHVSYDRSTDVWITPKVILPSADLNIYGTIERKCFFQSERHLKYFKIYTQNNCRLECEWNETITKNGCSPIGVPRE